MTSDPTRVSGLREYLISRRKTFGLSQTTVAFRMGTKQSVVSDLEVSEAFNPTLRTLRAWAKALDVELSVGFTALETTMFPLDAEEFGTPEAREGE